MRHQRPRAKSLSVAQNRREFVKCAGLALLAVHCLPASAFASGFSPSDIAPNADDLIIESGPGALHHVHYLHIPRALLKAPPPGGAVFTTSKAFLHQHRIALTQKELRAVSNGGSVAQRASSHVFVISLASGVREPTT